MPTGPGEVLDLIRHGRASTRGEILEATGLSRMTVAQRIDALLSEGLIVEGLAGAATGGRRSKSLRFNAQHSRALAATVETTHTRVAVTDLDGTMLAEENINVAVADGPQSTLDAIGNAAQVLLEKAGVEPGSVAGLGISVPGPIDPETGRPSQPPIMPGWDAYPIADHLTSLLGLEPVLAANDADATALGEHTVGHSRARALCLVKVSTGIGTGIVIDGQIYRGADGGAGDVGHVRLREHTEAQCQCGAHGCLAAVASGRAVAAQLGGLGRDVSSGRDVRALLAAGDAEAARLTREAGLRIGEVMATIVCVLNPEVMVVGGDLASAPLLAGIRETLYRLSLPRATRHMTLELGTLGDDAAIVGLTRMVVDDQFSARAVNARLTS